MYVTDEGILICVNDMHPSNACIPIDVTEDGIITSFKGVLF